MSCILIYHFTVFTLLAAETLFFANICKSTKKKKKSKKRGWKKQRRATKKWFCWILNNPVATWVSGAIISSSSLGELLVDLPVIVIMQALMSCTCNVFLFLDWETQSVQLWEIWAVSLWEQQIQYIDPVIQNTLIKVLTFPQVFALSLILLFYLTVSPLPTVHVHWILCW